MSGVRCLGWDGMYGWLVVCIDDMNVVVIVVVPVGNAGQERNAANQIGINLKLTISESQLTLEVNVIKTI